MAEYAVARVHCGSFHTAVLDAERYQIPQTSEGAVERVLRADGVAERWTCRSRIGLATIRVGTMTAREDEEHELRKLMIRYQQGDAAAVEELVARLSPRLLRFLAGPQSPREETEDILQDCWMRIHRSRQTYRPSEPLLPWLFAVARHSRLDAWRRGRRRGRREVLVAEAPEVPERDSTKRGGDDISALMEELPEEQREVLLMMKVSGMSVAEVARAIQSTPGAVKQKAHRAYKKLRELFRDRGYGSKPNDL